MKIEKR